MVNKRYVKRNRQYNKDKQLEKGAKFEYINRPEHIKRYVEKNRQYSKDN